MGWNGHGESTYQTVRGGGGEDWAQGVGVSREGFTGRDFESS